MARRIRKSLERNHLQMAVELSTALITCRRGSVERARVKLISESR